MESITESKRPRNWTRKRINAELKARGMRQAELVPLTGRSQPMVSEVVGGNRKSLPVALVIAEALGHQPHEIWPRLYAPPSGEPMAEAGDDLTENRRNAIRRDRRMERRHAQEGPNGPPLQPIGPDESIPHAS